MTNQLSSSFRKAGGEGNNAVHYRTLVVLTKPMYGWIDAVGVGAAGGQFCLIQPLVTYCFIFPGDRTESFGKLLGPLLP